MRPARWIVLAVAATAVALLAACGGSGSGEVAGVSPAGVGSLKPTGGAALSGTSWTLTSGTVTASPSPAPTLAGRGITLEFTSNQARGESVVNSYSATYASHDDGRLKLGPIISTMKAGDPGAMRVEAEYLSTLGKVTGYSVRNGTLDLFIGPDVVLTYATK